MEVKCYKCKMIEKKEFPPVIKRVSDVCYRCSVGRYDVTLRIGSKSPRWFAWGGITKPNKTVAAAQRDCSDYQQNG